MSALKENFMETADRMLQGLPFGTKASSGVQFHAEPSGYETFPNELLMHFQVDRRVPLMVNDSLDSMKSVDDGIPQESKRRAAGEPTFRPEDEPYYMSLSADNSDEKIENNNEVKEKKRERKEEHLKAKLYHSLEGLRRNMGVSTPKMTREQKVLKKIRQAMNDAETNKPREELDMKTARDKKSEDVDDNDTFTLSVWSSPTSANSD